MAKPEQTTCRSGGKRARNAGQSREMILQAAMQLFKEQPYDKVQTRKIAALAGVDAALVNRYFGSKRQLFAEVLERRLATYQLFAGENFEERLRKSYSDLISGITTDTSINSLTAMIFSYSNPEVSTLVQESFGRYIVKFAEKLGDAGHISRACTVLAHCIGMAIIMYMFEEKKRKELDVNVFMKSFDDILNGLPTNSNE